MNAELDCDLSDEQAFSAQDTCTTSAILRTFRFKRVDARPWAST